MVAYFSSPFVIKLIKGGAGRVERRQRRKIIDKKLKEEEIIREEETEPIVDNKRCNNLITSTLKTPLLV